MCLLEDAAEVDPLDQLIVIRNFEDEREFGDAFLLLCEPCLPGKVRSVFDVMPPSRFGIEERDNVFVLSAFDEAGAK